MGARNVLWANKKETKRKKKIVYKMQRGHERERGGKLDKAHNDDEKGIQLN